MDSNKQNCDNETRESLKGGFGEKKDGKQCLSVFSFFV